MYKSEHKTKEEKGRNSDNSSVSDKPGIQRKKAPVARFTDNRTDAVQLQQLQEMIGNGSKTQAPKTTQSPVQKKEDKHTLQMVGNLSRRFTFVVNGVDQHREDGDDRHDIEVALRHIPNFSAGNAYWNGNGGLNVWVHTLIGTPVSQVRDTVTNRLPHGAYMGEITRQQ